MALLPHPPDYRFKYAPAVQRAELALPRPLGMGHHAEHVPLLAQYPRYIGERAVGVGVLADNALGRRVPERDPSLAFEPLYGLGLRVVVAVGGGYRDVDDLPSLVRFCERGGRVPDLEVNVAADELEPPVPHEHAGPKAGLRQHLETVADADDEPAPVGEGDYLAHYRRRARDGACPQVVAVGKAARQYDAVEAVEARGLLP